MNEPTTVPSPSRRRILLVEDNEAAGKGLARLLQVQGFEVTTVLDGRSAIEALGGDHPPDYLLTDLQLPDMDGREIARHARQLTPPPRIILITGWDLPTEPEDPAESGIARVLTKPVDLQTLVEALNG
jgi:two-component system cell cycle response regulator CpdR